MGGRDGFSFNLSSESFVRKDQRLLALSTFYPFLGKHHLNSYFKEDRDILNIIITLCMSQRLRDPKYIK
jgi:hypothetical protein